MKIGRLRDRIAFIYFENVPDDMGGFEVTPRAYGTVWGELRSPRIREQLAAGMSVSALAYEIVIRRGVPVKPGWKAIVQGRSFEVTGVYDYDRESTCVLVIEEVR